MCWWRIVQWNRWLIKNFCSCFTCFYLDPDSTLRRKKNHTNTALSQYTSISAFYPPDLKNLFYFVPGGKRNISLLDRYLFVDKILITFLFFTQWFSLCAALKPQPLLCALLLWSAVVERKMGKKVTTGTAGVIILMWFCSKYLVCVGATAGETQQVVAAEIFRLR